MKFIPGMLVAALAVPLSFAQQANTQGGSASQATTDAQHSTQSNSGQQTGITGSGTTASQPGQQTDNGQQSATQTVGGADSQSTGAGRMRGNTADHSGHEAGAAGRAGNTSTRSRTAEGGESMLGNNDRRFVMEAAQGNMAEVQLAQLAQEKASSDEVKQLARAIGEDHEKANQRLKEVFANRSVTMPDDVAPKHKQLMTKLQGTEGAAFDRAYVDAMVKGHKADLSKYQKQSRSAMDTDVREYAEATVPHLQKHLEQAQQARTSVRNQSSNR